MSVNAHKQSAGRRRRRKKFVWTFAKDEQLRELWGRRLSVHEIAEEIGCPKVTAKRRAERIGLPKHDVLERKPRAKSMWTCAVTTELMRLVEAGWNTAEIAAELNCTPNAVISKVSRCGLTLRGTRRLPRIQGSLSSITSPLDAACGDAVAFMDMTAASCRWPRPAPKNAADAFYCCGRPRKKGSSYCAKHHHKAHCGTVFRLLSGKSALPAAAEEYVPGEPSVLSNRDAVVLSEAASVLSEAAA